MLKFLKYMFSPPKEERDHPIEEKQDHPFADVVVKMIWMQLPLSGLDPASLSTRLNNDDFALGYIFGLADMANYQFNTANTGQESALAYIHHIFTESLGGGAQENFSRALQIQNSAKFALGRKTGADEFGAWVKSQGSTSAHGLISHFLER